MRYLVVIPPDRDSADASFHDFEAHQHVAVDDQLIVDDLRLRVRSLVDVPADDGYDATLICTTCEYDEPRSTR